VFAFFVFLHCCKISFKFYLHLIAACPFVTFVNKSWKLIAAVSTVCRTELKTVQLLFSSQDSNVSIHS